MPLVDAFAAGLWLYWITPVKIICVEQPSISIVDERLHNETGPAVNWPAGECYWFWKGVQVPQQIIESPELITATSISKEKNAEVRRVMIERFGYGRYMTEIDGHIIHSDWTGKLWRSKRSRSDGIDELAVVEVVNGSPEPDGSHKSYFLSVPSDCKTALEAVSWTYGMTPNQYQRLQGRT